MNNLQSICIVTAYLILLATNFFLLNSDSPTWNALVFSMDVIASFLVVLSLLPQNVQRWLLRKRAPLKGKRPRSPRETLDPSPSDESLPEEWLEVSAQQDQKSQSSTPSEKKEDLQVETLTEDSSAKEEGPVQNQSTESILNNQVANQCIGCRHFDQCDLCLEGDAVKAIPLPGGEPVCAVKPNTAILLQDEQNLRSLLQTNDIDELIPGSCRFFEQVEQKQKPAKKKTASSKCKTATDKKNDEVMKTEP